jgi:uncharacterized MAPEG superfamily protein
MRTQYDRAAARFSGRISSMSGGMILALLAAATVWFAAVFLIPPLRGPSDPVAKLEFAIKCTCIAVLFCFLTGIEAISHERLQSDGFDPLAKRDSQRLLINIRYLQNTLEQLVLFVAGLLGLALYASDGKAMAVLTAATVVWVLARIAFWIGYQFGPQNRLFGLNGMQQSMLVLRDVAGSFGYELAGAGGAAAPIVLFLLIEAFMVVVTRRRPPQTQGRS